MRGRAMETAHRPRAQRRGPRMNRRKTRVHQRPFFFFPPHSLSKSQSPHVSVGGKKKDCLPVSPLDWTGLHSWTFLVSTACTGGTARTEEHQLEYTCSDLSPPTNLSLRPLSLRAKFIAADAHNVRCWLAFGSVQKYGTVKYFLQL